MKLSILHISDLHRDPSNPIRNDVLLDSLENDRRHYSTEETPAIRAPELIIVSGDIIQGIRADAADPDKELSEQYAEALDFLGKLADRFVGGNRERVIVIPGNHDVSAYHFEKSLKRVDIVPEKKIALVAKLFSTDSNLRWSWTGLELFEIADPAMYVRRLAAFAAFYTAFYGASRKYDLDPARHIDIFDFPEFGLCMAGFSSCHNNDLLNKQGAIHPACIADAGTCLRTRAYDGRLRIAVWHHNAEGLPMQSDYMDPDVIQNLIDRGFSLGFHGHQHRPQYLDTRFRHGVDRRISVISAGTLCGGASFGHRRAYNILELDLEKRTGRLHVREMQNDNLTMPIWGRRPLPPNPSPYYDFSFDPPPEPAVHTDPATAALLKAQTLIDNKDYEAAATILRTVAASDELARPILLECYTKTKNPQALLEVFDPPASAPEAIHVMDALWSENKRERLSEVLALPIIANTADTAVIEIRNKYSGRLKK
jgi:hypothetical protein